MHIVRCVKQSTYLLDNRVLIVRQPRTTHEIINNRRPLLTELPISVTKIGNFSKPIRLGITQTPLAMAQEDAGPRTHFRMTPGKGVSPQRLGQIWCGLVLGWGVAVGHRPPWNRATATARLRPRWSPGCLVVAPRKPGTMIRRLFRGHRLGWGWEAGPRAGGLSRASCPHRTAPTSHWRRIGTGGPGRGNFLQAGQRSCVGWRRTLCSDECGIARHNVRDREAFRQRH